MICTWSHRVVAALATTMLAMPACATSHAHAEARSILDDSPPMTAPRQSQPSPQPQEYTAPQRAEVNEGALAEHVDARMVIDAVVARSPSLKARSYRVRALAAEALATGRLPPPMAMATLWQAPLRSPFFYGDGSMLMLGLQQTFPPGGSLDASARAQVEEAKIEASMLLVDEQELALRAARAYIDYADAARRLRVLDAQRALVAQLTDTARARLSSGSAALSDITRAQLDAAKLDAEREGLDGARRRAAAELNVLLGRPAGAPLGAPAEEPPQTTATTLDEALSLANEHRAELEAARAIERRERARNEAADAMIRAPEYTVGLSYGLMRQSDMPDTWGANFSMTLPWLSPAYGARKDATNLATQSAHHATDAQSQETAREVATAFTRVDSATRQLAVLRQVRATAARSVDAARAAYVSSGDVVGWLDALRSTLDISMSEAATRAELDLALAELDRAAGALVPRQRIAEEGSNVH